MRIVVTAGYGRSLHAIVLLHELSRRGHSVVACLEVSTLNLARARAYLRQLGWRRLANKVRARFTSGHVAGHFADEVAPMRQMLVERSIGSRSVRSAAAAIGARHVVVPDLNNRRALDELRRVAPDVVAYAGGGIVKKEFLSVPVRGVLNVHGGPLPAFRGMNAAEWAVLHGVTPACVAHWMEATVDTGPMLAARETPMHGLRSIAHLRGVMTRMSVELMLDAIDAVAEGRAVPTPQQRAAGRLFHVMAAPMLEVVEQRLRSGAALSSGDVFQFRAPPAAVPTHAAL